MTSSEKFAYRPSLRALVVVFACVFVVGLISDGIGRGRSNLEKSEGFIADLHAIATGVPRSFDGTILRQGPLPTGWLYDAGALPPRLQAMAGTLRGAEDQRSLGLVRRGPWSFVFPLETKDSLVWTSMYTVPRAVCQQFADAIVKHPEQAAYISSFGNPAVIPAVQDRQSMCQRKFNSFALVSLDPPTEIRRLAADIRSALKAAPDDLVEKMPISGSSASFQVNKGQDGGPGFIQNEKSRTRVTLNNVSFAVCRLALILGPEAFAMEAFETADGTAAPLPLTGPAPEAMCSALKGRLVMTRSRAG